MNWDVEAEGFVSSGGSPGAGSRRDPSPSQGDAGTVSEVMHVGFLSLLWVTFLLVLCSSAVCFNNRFLPIAQWLLFSCINRAATFITRANIAACASSFPFVMV